MYDGDDDDDGDDDGDMSFERVCNSEWLP